MLQKPNTMSCQKRRITRKKVEHEGHLKPSVVFVSFLGKHFPHSLQKEKHSKAHPCTWLYFLAPKFFSFNRKLVPYF